MKDFKLSVSASAVFITLFVVLSLLFVPLIVKQFAISHIDNTYSNINKEANLFELMYQTSSSKVDFPSIAQKAIENKQMNNAFLSIIDWTGNNVCFPDITKVGEGLIYDKTIDFKGEINGESLYLNFYNYFNSLKKENDIEIVNLKPIKGSDLILVYHLNVKEVKNVITLIKEQTYFVFMILGLFLLLLLLTIVRFVGNFTSKILDEKILSLEYNAKSLSKLNDSISSYQQRLSQESEKESTAIYRPEEISKQRILTYVRNELVSISITEIAYIYVDSTITYIIQKDGKMATSNDSLDKVYSILDKELFFKTNRQFIVAISAIEKITKFENNKLKIQVKPKSEIDIIIGKNKASAFKQWLDL